MPLAASDFGRSPTASLLCTAASNHEGDAGGTELALIRQVILPVRIDDSQRRWQMLARLVVIDDHHFDPELLGMRHWIMGAEIPQSTVTSQRHAFGL